MKIVVKNRSTWEVIVALWIVAPFIIFPVLGNLIVGDFGILIGIIAAVVWLFSTVKVS